MSEAHSLETLCGEINQMEVASRIRAIELILHSLPHSEPQPSDTPLKKGRFSELRGIFKGAYSEIDIDQFIREERDSWDS